MDISHLIPVCKQLSGAASPGAPHTQLDSVRLARQEKNVEAGQVTEYEGITYATIKVRPCIVTMEVHCVAMLST